eukprot:303980-Chlamydomonas_euryale.AAC.21
MLTASMIEADVQGTDGRIHIMHRVYARSGRLNQPSAAPWACVDPFPDLAPDQLEDERDMRRAAQIHTHASTHASWDSPVKGLVGWAFLLSHGLGFSSIFALDVKQTRMSSRNADAGVVPYDMPCATGTVPRYLDMDDSAAVLALLTNFMHHVAVAGDDLLSCSSYSELVEVENNAAHGIKTVASGVAAFTLSTGSKVDHLLIPPAEGRCIDAVTVNRTQSAGRPQSWLVQALVMCEHIADDLDLSDEKACAVNYYEALEAKTVPEFCRRGLRNVRWSDFGLKFINCAGTGETGAFSLQPTDDLRGPT